MPYCSCLSVFIGITSLRLHRLHAVLYLRVRNMLWKLFKNTVRSKDCIWLCEEFSDATLGEVLVTILFLDAMMYFDIHTHHKPSCPDSTVYSYAMGDNLSREGIKHCSVGIHPWYLTSENAEEQLKWLLQEVCRKDVVAIGECGLDKLRGPSMSLQQTVFRECVLLSEEKFLPLIVHTVKCTEELIRIKKELKPHMPWIIHGFRGRREVALEYIKHGFYLSFGEKFQEDALRCVPFDRLFIETDDSLLAITAIYQKVAKSYGISMELLMEHIASNFEKVLFLR